MRMLWLAIGTLLALAATAGVAAACSCVPPGDPRAELAQADAAVFGEVVAVQPLGPDRPFTPEVTFQVRALRDYKDNLPDVVTVRTASTGPACGVTVEAGQRIGLLLTRLGDAWATNSCQTRSREHLEQGASPLPAPTGFPQSFFLLAGDFGGPRVAGLDAQGAVVGYGAGGGRAVALAACPGGRTALELLADGSLATRAAESLQETGRRALPDGARAVTCRSPDGADAVAFARTGARRARLERLGGGNRRAVWRGRASSVAFGARAAFVGSPAGVRAVALDSGAVRRVSGAGGRVLAASPDGRTLAVGRRQRLRLVDVRSGRVVGVHRGYAERAAFPTNRRVAVADATRGAVLNRRGRVVRRIPAGVLAPLGDRRLAVAAGRRLHVLGPNGRRLGPARPLFAAPTALVALPAGAARAARRPCPDS